MDYNLVACIVILLLDQLMHEIPVTVIGALLLFSANRKLRLLDLYAYSSVKKYFSKTQVFLFRFLFQAPAEKVS